MLKLAFTLTTGSKFLILNTTKFML